MIRRPIPYCTGTHSLLSERLAREKRAELEKPEAKLDKTMPEYLPPCFWLSSAFADHPTKPNCRAGHSRLRTCDCELCTEADRTKGV
jgi:hypothetical protein